MLRRALLAVGCVAVVLVASAQERPDFSGTWKQTGTSPGYSCIKTIDHQDPALKVTTRTSSVGGRLASGLYFDQTYRTDGKEQTTTNSADRVRTSSAHWEGATLVFLTADREGAQISLTRRAWTLSDDGMMLTEERRTVRPDGTTDERLVFARQ